MLHPYLICLLISTVNIRLLVAWVGIYTLRRFRPDPRIMLDRPQFQRAGEQIHSLNIGPENRPPHQI